MASIESADDASERLNGLFDAFVLGGPIAWYATSYRDVLRAAFFKLRKSKWVARATPWERLVLELTFDHILFNFGLCEGKPEHRTEVAQSISENIKRAQTVAPTNTERLAVVWACFTLPRRTAGSPERAWVHDGRELARTLRALRLDARARVIQSLFDGPQISPSRRELVRDDERQRAAVVRLGLTRALLPPQTARSLRLLHAFLDAPDRVRFVFGVRALDIQLLS